MRGFLLPALAMTILFTAAALAESGGKTADGCSYKIINGQYLTSCPNPKSRPNSDSRTAIVTQPAARDSVRVNSGRPIGSYGDVPVRHNPEAAAPELAPQQPVNVNRNNRVSSAIELDSKPESSLEDLQDGKREAYKSRLLDQTYVGLTLGASNMKQSNSGSTVGLGLNLGTNIDDHFGVELGYGYAKQNLSLGLASRGAMVDQFPNPNSTTASDSTLTSHLFTGEVQAHLTDPVKRLRPFLGAGLGWRSATLSENRSQQLVGQDLGYYQSTGGGSLRQSAFGGLASAGTKLRIAKAWNLGFAFRYFFPLARQESRIEQPVGGSAGQPTGETKLSKGDDLLTGSSQYQVLGGVHYSF
jgi:outer membrane protein W